MSTMKNSEKWEIIPYDGSDDPISAEEARAIAQHTRTDAAEFDRLGRAHQAELYRRIAAAVEGARSCCDLWRRADEATAKYLRESNADVDQFLHPQDLFWQPCDS